MGAHPELILKINRYRRCLVGRVMDAHPAIFPKPFANFSWEDHFEQNDTVENTERTNLEIAIGLFSQSFRLAQNCVISDAPMKIDEFFSDENFPSIDDILDPDPIALLVVGGPDNKNHTPDILAFARAMAAIKLLIRANFVSIDNIYEAMTKKLDSLPRQSQLKSSILDAVKQMIQNDLEIILSDANNKSH